MIETQTLWKVNPTHCDIWFSIIDVPQEEWLINDGCVFDEWFVEQRRRVHKEADQKLKEAMGVQI